MKEFLEDLGKRLGETAELVTNKAGEAIEIQRIKSQMRELARGNAVDLMDLGKAVYDRYLSGDVLDDDAKALCDAIKGRKESIAEYEKKIAKIRGAFECAGCGKMVSKDMAYCPYCGEKVPEQQETEECQDDVFVDEYAEKVKEKVADTVETVAEKVDHAVDKVEKAVENLDEK